MGDWMVLYILRRFVGEADHGDGDGGDDYVLCDFDLW